MQGGVLPVTDGKDVCSNKILTERVLEDESDKQLLLQTYNFFMLLFLGLAGDANHLLVSTAAI